MTTISIAMATYNGARFIREQLDSLAAQTYLPMELVVTDDGSTDATLEIIADFAKTAPFPVRVHQNEERLGYKANFMKCANLCAGDLIAFCDQDDIWEPIKLALMQQQILNSGVLLAFHNSFVVSASLKFRSYYWTKHQAYRLLSIKSTPWADCPGFSLLFKKELLQFNDLWRQSIQPGKDEVMPHDNWLFFIASALMSVIYVDKPLVKYRQHSTNTVGYRSGEGPIIRTLRKLNTPLLWDRSASKAALLRVDSLKQLGSRAKLDTEQYEALNEYGELYATLSKRLDRRAELWSSSSKIKKVSTFLRNVSFGDYSLSNKWKFTVLGGFRDIFLSLSGRYI